MKELKDNDNQEQNGPTNIASNPVETACRFIRKNWVTIACGGAAVVFGGICIHQRVEIKQLKADVSFLSARVGDLIAICEEKDAWFKELISDGLRHGSSLAGKCMVDRRDWLLGK